MLSIQPNVSCLKILKQILSQKVLLYCCHNFINKTEIKCVDLFWKIVFFLFLETRHPLQYYINMREYAGLQIKSTGWTIQHLTKITSRTDTKIWVDLILLKSWRCFQHSNTNGPSLYSSPFWKLAINSPKDRNLFIRVSKWKQLVSNKIVTFLNMWWIF